MVECTRRRRRSSSRDANRLRDRHHARRAHRARGDELAWHHQPTPRPGGDDEVHPRGRRRRRSRGAAQDRPRPRLAAPEALTLPPGWRREWDSNHGGSRLNDFFRGRSRSERSSRSRVCAGHRSARARPVLRICLVRQGLMGKLMGKTEVTRRPAERSGRSVWPDRRLASPWPSAHPAARTPLGS